MAATIEVHVPLGALSPERFLASGAPLPPACARPGSVAEPTGAAAGVPITAAHVRDLLAQLDAAGLHTPPGGSLSFSFTDDTGALQAVATLRELRHAARRGCREHPAGACGCPVLDRPAPTEAYTPTAAQHAFLTTRTGPAGFPPAGSGWGGPTATTSSRTPTAARPTAPP